MNLRQKPHRGLEQHQKQRRSSPRGANEKRKNTNILIIRIIKDTTERSRFNSILIISDITIVKDIENNMNKQQAP